MDGGDSVKQSAQALSKAVSGLGRLGVDVAPIQALGAVATMVQGGIAVWTGAKLIADNMTRVNEAKFIASLTKYGPAAFAFAASATLTAVAVEQIITRALGDVGNG